jgi:hypothetical protein
MKRYIMFIVRLALTIALFAWLLRDSALRAQLATLPRPPAPGWLIPAWIAAGLNELASLLRWWCCLHLAGIAMPLRRAAALHFLGLFTSLFLPGMAGGDAVKIAFLALQFPQRKMGGVLAVLMDRLSGFVSIIVWTFIVAMKRGEWFRQTPATAALFHAVLIFLGVAAGALIVWFISSRAPLLRRTPQWIPLRARIIEIAAVFNTFLADRRRAFAALALSTASHASYFLVFYFTALAFAGSLSLGDAFSIMPLMDVVSMLPVTISGLGLRETTMQALLTPLCGIAPGTAVFISLCGFLVTASWAFAGVSVFIRFRAVQKTETIHA